MLGTREQDTRDRTPAIGHPRQDTRDRTPARGVPTFHVGMLGEGNVGATLAVAWLGSLGSQVPRQHYMQERWVVKCRDDPRGCPVWGNLCACHCPTYGRPSSRVCDDNTCKDGVRGI